MHHQIGVFDNVNGRGPEGMGAAKGKVKPADAKRLNIEITWDNGVVFTR